MDLLPLKRPSLRDQALAVIRQALVAGEIRPGSIYSASGMASRLGTSNGPVREAMLALVNQGVMEVVPNRGFRVTPVTDKDLDEIYQLRLLLFHQRRGGTQAAEDRDMRVLLESDRDFHLGMLGLLENGRLVPLVEMLRDQTRLYGLHTLAEEGKLVATAQEHFDLLEALLSGDPDRAGAEMARHLAHVPDADPAGA